jgi:hypothetical protein
MYRTAGGVLALLLAGTVLASAARPPDEPAPVKQYQALVKEFQDATQAWSKGYQAAKTPEERRKLAADYPRPDKFAPKFLKLAEKHPKDPVALDALVWVVTNAGPGQPGSPAAKAVTLLGRDHIRSDKLGPVCGRLAYAADPESEKFLRAVLDKNPHKDVQGPACLALGQVVKSRARQDKELAKEAEGLFERAAKEYGDVKLGRTTVGERARGELFEIRHLAIGMVVPDILGTDADGKKFKLSDYRGKVVLIDFWGNW